MSELRLRRLQSDYEAVRRLARRHPRIEVDGVGGDPPQRYLIRYRVSSLRERGEEIVVARNHQLEIVLPSTYPRDPPLCRMLTPVFHPNIAPHAVCIGDHWTAGESLDLMIQRIGEMLAFQSYNVKSPLNGLAARWIEEHPDRVPVDAEEFFVDLADADQPAAEPGRRCSNCGGSGLPLTACAAGHPLCPNCLEHCERCGRLLCLTCGESACPACAPACANCGAAAAGGRRCAAGHAACADCAAACPLCGRALCLACGESACPVCAAAREPAPEAPAPAPPAPTAS